MKIALAQLNYTIGDIDGNTAKIIAAVERAKSEGADVVVFAEQAVSGTPAFDLLRKTTFLLTKNMMLLSAAAALPALPQPSPLLVRVPKRCF